MTSLLNEVLPLFSTSQETAACHQKNSLLLRKVYQKSGLGEFWKAFLHPIILILETDMRSKNPYADRIIEFIGHFCTALKRLNTSEDGSFIEDPLITKLLGYLLQVSECISDTVRFRSCQLINKVLDNLTGLEISDDLDKHMQEMLIKRLSDSKGAIRLQAIVALHRLQDPSCPDDPVISEFIQLMHDNQAKVRRLCVEKIACRRDVVKYIEKRTRDTDINVRLAAYKRLGKFAKLLKITDRRTVLFAGLFDSSDKVKDYVSSDFLSSWYEIYDNNIMELMKSLRLDADEKDIDTTLKLYDAVLNKYYFKTRKLSELRDVLPLNEEKLLPYVKLNWETVTYWRYLIELLNSNADFEPYLENVAPEVVFFCFYIKEYCNYSVDDSDDSYMEKQFVIRQLFHIIKTYDLSDPHSTQSIHVLVDYVLKKEDLMDDTIEIIVGTLEKTVPDPDMRCRYAMEIVSDILYPVDVEEEVRRENEKEFQLTKLKVHLTTLKISLDDAIAKTDFIEADRLKHLISDVTFQLHDLKNSIYAPPQVELKRKDDLPTICKCLDIVWAVLRCANVFKLTPSLTSLKSDFLPELLVHQNEIVRLKALRCYAICCVFDKSTAQQGIHIFAVPILSYQAGEECDTQTLMTCISAVSDLIRIYGDDLMAQPNEDQLSESVSEEHQKVFAGGTSLTSLVQGLVDLMDNEQYEIQLKACEGLCKIVLDERIHSPSVISRLILKWCHSMDEDAPEGQALKQFIGHILERLPNLPDSSGQLEGALLLTINTLARAPRNGPLANVDIDNIAKFILTLCKLSPKGQKVHCNIALSLCSKINEHPDNKINSVYSKVLLILDLPKDRSILEEIFSLVEEAREYIDDKGILKNITKFLSILNGLLIEDTKMPEVTDEFLSDLTEEEEEEFE